MHIDWETFHDLVIFSVAVLKNQSFLHPNVDGKSYPIEYCIEQCREKKRPSSNHFVDRGFECRNSQTQYKDE